MCLIHINTSTNLSIVDTYTVANIGNPIYIPREISNVYRERFQMYIGKIYTFQKIYIHSKKYIHIYTFHERFQISVFLVGKETNNLKTGRYRD